MNTDTKSNKKCVICNGYLFDDDDIVVCPVCGAPHHRDCYDTVGKCGLTELHGTEQSYDKTVKKSEEEAENVNVCTDCGKSYEKGANFCPYCGKPYADGVKHSADGRFTPGDRFTFHADPDGKIEDVSEKDLTQYLGVSAINYLPKFKRLTQKAKKSWNWAAFLFPGAWSLSRKMYANGIICILASVISSLSTLPINRILSANCAEMTYGAMTDYLMNNIANIGFLPILLPMIGLALMAVPRILCGLYGDWCYRGTVLSRIKTIKDETESVDLEETLAHDGAINLFVLLGGLFAEAFLPDLILQLLL